MEPRVNVMKVAPGIRDAMMGLMHHLGQSGLGEPLINLLSLGRNHRTTRNASAPLSPGPKPFQRFATDT